MIPINQIVAEAILLELWKARCFDVNNITEMYPLNSGQRLKTKLRTSDDRDSFISKSAVLWNKMSEEFRTATSTLNTAKNEIRKFVRGLPGVYLYT